MSNFCGFFHNSLLNFNESWAYRLYCSFLLLFSSKTIINCQIVDTLTWSVNVAVFDLVAVYTKLVETMTTDKMNRRQNQFLVTSVACLLVEVFSLLLHQTDVLPHLIDTLAHLLDSVFFNFALFVHLAFLFRFDYPLLVLQFLNQKRTQNVKL